MNVHQILIKKKNTILLGCARSICNDAVTLRIAAGGVAKDLSSVKLFRLRVFNASSAAFKAGNAFCKSRSHSACRSATRSFFSATSFSSIAAASRCSVTFFVSLSTTLIRRSAS
jgi:hypothetical protein